MPLASVILVWRIVWVVLVPLLLTAYSVLLVLCKSSVKTDPCMLMFIAGIVKAFWLELPNLMKIPEHPTCHANE